jgi:hypothetical protein
MEHTHQTKKHIRDTAEKEPRGNPEKEGKKQQESSWMSADSNFDAP